MTTVDNPKVSQTSGKDEDPKEKGFFNRSRAGGKSIWDWMQLLIIPFVLVIVGSYFSYQQTQTSLQVSHQQHQQDQQSALDQQQAIILQTYIDNIQDLLLNHNLLKAHPVDFSDPYYNIAALARARTLTALQGLDPERKGRLVQFIYSANLIGFINPGTNPTKGILEPPIINLAGTNLSYAILYTKYSTARLYADFNGANFSFADLSHANLFHIFLSRANLSGADLTDAVLTDDYLYGADLADAVLRDANLSHAQNLTQLQLDQVFTCKGAILPPGLTCHHNQ